LRYGLVASSSWNDLIVVPAQAEEVRLMSTRLGTAPIVATHLSPEQLARLRSLLIEEHAIQQGRAAELQDAPDLEPDLAEVLLARCQEALDEISEALRLSGSGAYGLCSACRSAIPYERLEAVPATRHCVSCQSGRDRLLR
jgi:RNA polymerase-binding transcription factor DksA